MKRKEQVNIILRGMSFELEEILEEPSLQELSAEECIGLAMEITMNELATEPEKVVQMSVAKIDRQKVLFLLDNIRAVPLFEGVEDDEDSIY